MERNIQVKGDYDFDLSLELGEEGSDNYEALIFLVVRGLIPNSQVGIFTKDHCGMDITEQYQAPQSGVLEFTELIRQTSQVVIPIILRVRLYTYIPLEHHVFYNRHQDGMMQYKVKQTKDF